MITMATAIKPVQDPYHDLNSKRDQDRGQRPVDHDRDQELRS